MVKLAEVVEAVAADWTSAGCSEYGSGCKWSDNGERSTVRRAAIRHVRANPGHAVQLITTHKSWLAAQGKQEQGQEGSERR